MVDLDLCGSVLLIDRLDNVPAPYHGFPLENIGDLSNLFQCE